MVTGLCRSIENSRGNGALRSLAVVALLAISVASALAEERKAVWVAAREARRGLNVVRDDGRVVSYWDVANAKGPRVIPGLENIVATTTELALRRDGVVLTWEPKCVRPQSSPEEYCEFPAAHRIAGLRDIVAIAQHNLCYLALDRNGAVWGWGDDSDGLISGQPALPTPTSKPVKRRLVKTPTRVPLPVPMVFISAGDAQGGAIDREGRAWTWGGGRLAVQLQAPGEDVAGPNGFVARRIAGLPPVRAIDVQLIAYVITKSGELWRWGVWTVNAKKYGSTEPSRVAYLTNIVAVSQIDFFTAVLDGDGAVRFIGTAPDKDNEKFVDQPHASMPMPPAKFISGGARITSDGTVLYFDELNAGVVQRLELGK